MGSAMRPVFTATSMTTQRPSPSARGTRRWQMMPRSEPASASRTCFCSCGGQRGGEPHLLLLVRREEVDDAVDGLGRVGGVQRRHDEVAGLGGGEAGLD